MSTIDSREIIDKIIANHGYYLDDPRVYMIVEFTNAWGRKTWGVTWSNETVDRKERYLIESEYIISPKIIWKAD